MLELCQELLEESQEVLDASRKEGEQPCAVPTFHLDELKIGDVLGNGSFARVHEISNIRLKKRSEDDGIDPWEETEEDVRRREAVRDSCTSGSDKLALKRLRDGLTGAQAGRGLVDIALEVLFLKSLVHPNIIRFVGLVHEEASFIMERLEETLTEKIQLEWSERYILAMSSGVLPGLPSVWSGETMTDLEVDLFVDRLLVGYDLANALDYLHQHK